MKVIAGKPLKYGLALAALAALVAVAALYWRSPRPLPARPPYPGPPPVAGGSDFAFTADVEFGADIGQHLGTLFEAYDKDNRLLCGAGFVSAYQTRRIVNNRALEFYCRSGDSTLTVQDLGPTAAGSVRTELLTRGDALIDVSVGTAGDLSGRWRGHETSPLTGRTQNIQIVAGKPLCFVHRCDAHPTSVVYDGQVIVEAPGDMLAGLYYNGVIYLAVRDDGGVARLLWWEWTPSRGEPGPVQSALLGAGLDIYAMIGYGDAVFLGGGPGALLRVKAGRVQSLSGTGDTGEFYAFLVCGDELLAGHYPSGYLYRVDPDALAVTHQAGPPVRRGQYVGAAGEPYREAQSIVLYRGDLFVGT